MLREAVRDPKQEALRSLVRVLRAVHQLKARRSYAAQQITGRLSQGDLTTLTGAEFEQLVDRLVRAMGLRVLSRSTGPDGGIDMIAEMQTDLLTSRYAIQCKCYTGKVGVNFVRELYGVVTSERLDKGVLITNSEFTRQAIDFARGKQLELVDGNRLQTLVARHLPTEGGGDFGRGSLGQAFAGGVELQRELAAIREGVLQRKRMLEQDLVPIRMQSLQSREGAVRFLGVNTTAWVNTSLTVWNQLDRLRELVCPSGDVLTGARDEMHILIENLQATIAILEDLRLEAYSRAVGPVREEKGSLSAVLVSLRNLYGALFEDITDSIQQITDFLAQTAPSEKRIPLDLAWNRVRPAYDRFVASADRAGISLELSGHSSDGAVQTGERAQEDIPFLRQPRKEEPPPPQPPSSPPSNRAPVSVWLSIISTPYVTKADLDAAWPNVEDGERPIGLLLGKLLATGLPCILLFTDRRLLVVHKTGSHLPIAVGDLDRPIDILPFRSIMQQAGYYVTITFTDSRTGQQRTVEKVPREELQRIMTRRREMGQERH